MPVIHVVLVEDDWIIAKEIAYTLQDLGFDVAGMYDTAEEAWKHLKQKGADIVLLDIDLAGDLTGIELAARLKAETNIPFIFLTALADYTTVSKAKVVTPYSYLVKPVSAETLFSSIEIALHNATNAVIPNTSSTIEKTNIARSESIFIKVKNRLEKLALQDVLYVEASDIYAYIHTAAGKFILNSNLKTIEEKLPGNFIRIHRSYIININKIRAIEEDEVLIEEKRLAIGKTYKEKLMASLSFL